MKVVIWMVLFAAAHYLGYSQPKLKDIISSSKRFYLRLEYGKFEVSYSFKSSIAESKNDSKFDIYFCKSPSIFRISAGSSEVLITDQHYYDVDLFQMKYVDLSKEKSGKKEKERQLADFPFYGRYFFKRFEKRAFRLETIGSTFHVYDLSEHYYFDTSNYSIIKYQQNILDKTGLQIKEWTILNELRFQGCSSPLMDLSFVKTYAKVKQLRPSGADIDLEGKIFPSLIADSVWHSYKGDSVLIKSFFGKYVLLDLFFQSCMPCIQSFKFLKDLFSKYAPGGKFTIVGIDPVLYDVSTMPRFAERYKLAYSIVVGDVAKRLSQSLNPNGILPFYILINPMGKIEAISKGYSEDFFAKVDHILNSWQNPQ